MFREELSKSLAFSEAMLREMTGPAKPGSDTGLDTGQSRPRGRYGGFQALIAISRVGARARRRRVAAAPADSDGDGPGGVQGRPGYSPTTSRVEVGASMESLNARAMDRDRGMIRHEEVGLPPPPPLIPSLAI